MTSNKIAKSIMIQGTASSSGKSLLATALCRILYQDGYRVAPFKAQNMSNNSFVTREGLEMGRAQVVQAVAAGLEPDIRMNPVLLKPTSDRGSQVVLRGKPAFTMDARAWHETRNALRNTIRECYTSLCKEHDIIVIEGAGSPAEINLKDSDIVNMGMAKMADSPVLIVGDIDRGGVFASLVGTLQLLDDDERMRVKGIIINKFRGEIELLKSGIEKLEAITGVPVLGVIPMIKHSIDDEDGVSERFVRKKSVAFDIDICVVRLPHISNYTDVIPLENVPCVNVRWGDTSDAIGTPDILILPGTKATIADLRTLKKAGIAQRIIEYAEKGGLVLGICGGFQMLGNQLIDRHRAESIQAKETGLGLLDMITEFTTRKQTTQVQVVISSADGTPFAHLNDESGTGYEIHMGQSSFGTDCVPCTYSIGKDDIKRVSGITNASGNIAGTYVHGFFDASSISTGFVNALRRKKGLLPLDERVAERVTILDRDINRLAGVVRETIDMQTVYRIAGLDYVGA